ncbi:MAG: DnaJ domain-containing protein [Clostridia bacterium]|nr:DnaJ domain-containing protein [Clostridia bacterium]
MSDPYRELGLSPGASREEVTKAYKKLAKKYHPDLHPNDPAAEEKMSRINEAYDRIRSGKADRADYEDSARNPYGSYRTAYDSYWGDPFGDRTYTRTENPRYEAILELLRRGHAYEAWQFLSRMSERDAQWYYLAAVANWNLGNKTSALSYAATAVQMEPGNTEYRDFLERIRAGGRTYTYRSEEYAPAGGVLCRSLLSACLCFLCGGRCIPCCW